MQDSPYNPDLGSLGTNPGRSVLHAVPGISKGKKEQPESKPAAKKIEHYNMRQT